VIADHIALAGANEQLQQASSTNSSDASFDGADASTAEAGAAPSTSALQPEEYAATLADVSPAPAPAAAAKPDAESGDSKTKVAAKPLPATRGKIAMKVGPSTPPATQPARDGGIVDGRARAAREPERVLSRAGKPGRLPPTIIRRGQKLTVTVDELAGPERDKTQSVEVAADGTIELPELAPVRVEGFTAAQAARVIGDAYKAAAVIDTPTVDVRPAAPAPSDPLAAPQPSSTALRSRPESPAKDEAAAAEESPVGTTFDFAAATRPSTGESASGVGQKRQQAQSQHREEAADELVDVVILVQTKPLPAAPTTTAPVIADLPTDNAQASPDVDADVNAAVVPEPANSAAPEAAESPATEPAESPSPPAAAEEDAKPSN